MFWDEFWATASCVSVNKFARSFGGKVDHIAKDKSKEETILPMPLRKTTMEKTSVDISNVV